MKTIIKKIEHVLRNKQYLDISLSSKLRKDSLFIYGYLCKNDDLFHNLYPNIRKITSSSPNVNYLLMSLANYTYNSKSRHILLEHGFSELSQEDKIFHSFETSQTSGEKDNIILSEPDVLKSKIYKKKCISAFSKELNNKKIYNARRC